MIYKECYESGKTEMIKYKEEEDMNKKATMLHRKYIPNMTESVDTETDRLIEKIVTNTNQTAVNKADEVLVMQTMLNDRQFRVGVYDRAKGYVGTRSPRDTAIGIAVDALSGATGMSVNEAKKLTADYMFTKRDATRFINLSKDFYSTYLQTGRKTILISEPRGEMSLNLKFSEGKEKTVPDRNNPGHCMKVTTRDSIKLNAINKI